MAGVLSVVLLVVVLVACASACASAWVWSSVGATSVSAASWERSTPALVSLVRGSSAASDSPASSGLSSPRSKSEPPSGISLEGVLVDVRAGAAESADSASGRGAEVVAGSSSPRSNKDPPEAAGCSEASEGSVSPSVSASASSPTSKSEPPEAAGFAVSASVSPSVSPSVSKSEPPDTVVPVSPSVSKSEPPDEAVSVSVSPPSSKRELPPDALARGPTSSVSVTVLALWVASPGDGSAFVASGSAAAGAAELRAEGAAGAAAAAGALVSPLTEASSIWATSRTSTSSRAEPSDCFIVRPSESITRQKGQPTAIWSAPVSMASWVRLRLIRSPMFSSIHIRAPPAPQQKERSELRGISVSSASGMTSSSSRGGE